MLLSFFFCIRNTMAINTNAPTGTGLKPVTSPTGLKLSSSPFTSQPDNEVAVVDVYEQQSAGVINSISEDVGESGSFFDKIKNAVTGGLSSLTGGLSLGSLAGGAKGALDSVRSGTNLLRQVTNVASRATSALNQIQRGGVMGTVGGLATLGGLGGVAGASRMASIARGVSYGIGQGGVGGLLRAGGSLLGNQGQSLNQLSSNIGAISRTSMYLQSAVSKGNFSSVLSGVDSSLALTSSTLSSLDRASQINFQTGFDSVLNNSSITARSYNQSSLGRVQTAIGDFTGRLGNTNDPISIPTRAGTTAGLAVMGASLGNNNVYSTVRSGGLDDESAFLAGSALSTFGVGNGNLSLIKDLSSDSVGLKAISSNPNAMKELVANLAPQPDQNKQSYASIYDDLSTASAATGQSWNSTTRVGSNILDVSAMIDNAYAKQMVAGKAAEDDFKARTTGAPVDSRQTSMSVAQAMAAVASVPQPTIESIRAENPSMDAAQARYELQRRQFYSNTKNLGR